MLSMKWSIVSTLEFSDHMVPMAATPLRHCTFKVAVDNASATEYGSVPTKAYVWMLKFAFHKVFKCREYYVSCEYFFSNQ